jgi:Tfp pilus assembly protein PilN
LKPPRRKKVLGLAIGDRSILVAEVVAGEQPQVTRLGELAYPEGVSPSTPELLGKLLGDFLREREFTARVAMVGLPARWLVVRPKEVPPADVATVTGVLRLAAEAEFPTDIKDLVFDFAGTIDSAEAKSVLLMATPQKYVDAAVLLCETARLKAVGVTSSAVALGEATGRSMSNDALVLSLGPTGGEMTSQNGNSSSAIRHLRPPSPQPPFVSEVRRALLTLSGGKTGRDLIVWDGAGLGAGYLGDNLGVNVRQGDLPALGVNTSAMSANGEGRKFAAAVALGLAGIGLGERSVDFLHSRLAPPKAQRVPRWVPWAVIAGVLLVGSIIYGIVDIKNQRADLDSLQSQYDNEKANVAVAEAFVAKVSFAQAWHGGDPRYLACLRDLTAAIPEDGTTYATSLTLHEIVRPANGQTASNASAAAKLLQGDSHQLSAQLSGKTSDNRSANAVQERLQQVKTFTDVRIVATSSNNNSREHDVTFSITWTYTPPKRVP